MNQDVKRHSHGFAGPLFIIGMPRSGTKLLRGLLNEHPRIGIPISETEFFPYWIAHWQEFGDLSKKEHFLRFYKQMLAAPYFISCRRDGRLIDVDRWFEWCHNFSPAGVFEALVRHDVGAEFGADKIWGDKSPSYISNLPMLKDQFPDAKFVHIIRDVRDYCLAINRAWGKNMLRAAQRWVDGVEGVMHDGQAFPADYMQLRYEHLLNDPQAELKRICAFLDIEYDERMCILTYATENIGAAKGEKIVVRTNCHKYINEMPLSLRNKIEAIAGSTLASLGDEVGPCSGRRRIPQAKMSIYKALDGANLLKSTIRRIGLAETVKYTFGALAVSKKSPHK